MFKVQSHYLLLLTLVFSTAHAPTFMFWRNATPAEEQTARILGTYRSLTGASQASLPREYAEDGEIKRFQLDEMYLPKLDVTLPELFNWGDLDREYLADTRAPVDEINFDPDNSRGASFRLASLAGGSVFANLGGGSSGGSPRNSAESSTPAGDSSDDGDSSQDGKGDPVSSSPADESTTPGDESNDASPGTDNTNTGGDQVTDPPPPSVLDPVDPNPEPVPVPAPGALGLVALGLAGLQLAGRKKKQKRLAAS